MATIILGFLLFAFLVNNIPFENAFHYTILLSAIYSISFVGPQFRAILDPTFGVWEYPLAYRPRIGSNLYLIPFELKKDGGLLKYTWLYYKLIFFTLFCCSALWLWLRANDAQSEHAEEGNVWLL
jgi:ABC-type sugar transport system permease subunit